MSNKYIEKERLAAFVDAVLAIIMTILVLELDKPKTYNLEGILELKEDFFAYALSFFWLGALWVNLYNSYQYVKKINRKVILSTILFLFFASFFPYTTKLIATEFNNAIIQTFYGMVVTCISISMLLYYRSIREIDVNNSIEGLKDSLNRRRWIKLDILIKVIGLLLTIFVYPPAISYAVLLTLLAFLILPNRL